MPGLIRGVVRTAAIAGTATAVSNRVSRRQANRWSQQADAEPEEPPAAASRPPSSQQPSPSEEDELAQLRELGELRSSGVLTEEEFEAQKARILSI